MVYRGKGLYKIGEHGIIIFEESIKQIDEAIISGNEEEDDFNLFGVTEGGLVYIERIENVKNKLEELYKVVPIRQGIVERPFNVFESEIGSQYSSTDHNIFGSGNVEKIYLRYEEVEM